MVTFFFDLKQRGRLFELTFVPRGESLCRTIRIDPAELVVFEELMLTDRRDPAVLHSKVPHYRLRTRGNEAWCFRVTAHDELHPLVQAAAAAERDVSAEVDARGARAEQQERLDK